MFLRVSESSLRWDPLHPLGWVRAPNGHVRPSVGSVPYGDPFLSIAQVSRCLKAFLRVLINPEELRKD